MRYKKSREKNLAKNTSFTANHQNTGGYDNNLLDDKFSVNTQGYHSLKSNGIKIFTVKKIIP